MPHRSYLGGMRRAAWRLRAADPFTQFVTAAVVLFALLFAQGGLLIGGSVIAVRESRGATEDTFAFLANVADERVSRFVEGAHRAARGVEASVSSGDAEDLGLMRALHVEMRAAPEVDFLSVAFPDGEYSSLERLGAPYGGYTAVTSQWRVPDGYVYNMAQYDSQLNLEANEKMAVAWDPTSEPAFVEASERRRPVWTYTDSNKQREATVPAYCVPVRSPDYELVAVVCARIDVDAMGRSIHELPQGVSADVLVLSAQRDLVAGDANAQASVRARVAAAKAPGSSEGAFRDAFLAEVATTGMADPMNGDMVFGRAGDDLTVEKGLPALGVDWIVHVRASETSINSGFVRLRNVVSVVLASLTLVTAALVVVLWRLRRPVRALRDNAIRDPLTGLLNRQGVQVKAVRLARAAQRQGDTVAVVMLDLDNFKGLNDDLGHAAGDEALTEIGRVLLGEVRGHDLAVRWGGDEFLLVLRFGPKDDAAQAIEKIRARIERSLVRQFGPGRDLGVTAGFALAAKVEAVGDISALIDDADVALVDGKWRRKGATYGAGMPGDAIAPTAPSPTA